MARSRRPDGRIQVQVDLGVADGKRQRKYFYGATLKEAQKARDAWLTEQKRREQMVIDAPDILMKTWGEMWLDSVSGTTQGTTHKSKISAVKKQNEFTFETAGVSGVAFGDIPVRDVKQYHVQAYMNSLSGKSKGTIALRRDVLTAILDAAVANGIIDTSPWRQVRSPRGTYKGHKAIPEQMQQLIADTYKEHRCGMWALAMMYTGMRREELAALDISSIDLQNDQITIQQAAVLKEGGRLKETKTEAGRRTVPILPQLKQPLTDTVAGRKAGRLFTAVNGSDLTATSFSQAWRSYMRFLNLHEGGADKKRDKDGPDGKARWIPKKIVIDPFTPHDLRYTYATILYDAGVDVKTAAALLGHKDITVTMKIYTQLSAMKKAQGVDSLIAYMKEKDKPKDEK